MKDIDEGSLALPRASLASLLPFEPHELVTAWIAAQPQGRASQAALVEKLAPLLPIGEALADAERHGLIERHGEIAVTIPKGSAVEARQPYGARRDILRDFAVKALRGPSAPKQAGPKRQLAALALRQLFQLDDLPVWPDAQHVRCALVARVMASLCEGALAGAWPKSAKGFRFDPMSRQLYLAFAGLQRGTVVQADAALLSAALGGPAGTVDALTATVLRAAMAAKKADPAGPPQTEAALDAFALSVRRLAGRLETKPFAGRVAIAQVYDAGLAAGLAFGSLEDFKARIAEAAREGLLDLERYDIAGPFDADLKERSRLRLGRDERHFIVNQWI